MDGRKKPNYSFTVPRRNFIGTSKIKSLSFNNFKPFSGNKLHSIKIKPITLLYGWNNSGKSSILELLQLMSSINELNNETLVKFNANNLLNIGSYRNYINKNDISKNLKILFEIDKVNPPLNYRLMNELQPIMKHITSGKCDVYFEYNSSLEPEKSEFAFLDSFSINIENLMSVKSTKDNYEAFQILDLELKSIDTDDFFKLLSKSRQSIISNLEALSNDIYNIDINPKNKNNLGYQINKHVNAIENLIKDDKRLLEELFYETKIPFSSVDYDDDLEQDFRERNEFSPMWSDGYVEHQGLNFYLESIYGNSQYSDLNEADLHIMTMLRDLENLDSPSYIKNVAKLLKMLEWELLENNSYTQLLLEYFSKGNKKVGKNFWDKFSRFLPTELQTGFITPGEINKKFVHNEKKISKARLQSNRDIVLKFLKIETEFVLERFSIYKLLDEIKSSCLSLKAKSPEIDSLASLTDDDDETDVPSVRIKIQEYEDLLENLKKWNGKEGKTLNKIKNIFFESFRKSIIFKSSPYRMRSSISTLDSENCLTLSSFMKGYLKNYNEDIAKNEFFQFIDNFSLIINSSISSAIKSTKARTFIYPKEEIKRFYEKKNFNSPGRHNENVLNYPYEYVFNILFSDTEVRKKVNESLRKMGFDFEINFETLSGKFDEKIFYSLAKNIKNKDINTNIADMGLGLKRIIPLITYLYHKRAREIICIQEPESNLHPKYQSEIAEILVDSFNKRGNTHLVETHSEILVLRLLKLIKQKKINSNDISINFVQKKDGEAEIINIDVNEDGEFTSEWPSGFFLERLSEL